MRNTAEEVDCASALPPQAHLCYAAQNTETQQAAHLWLLFTAICQTEALRVAAYLLLHLHRIFMGSLVRLAAAPDSVTRGSGASAAASPPPLSHNTTVTPTPPVSCSAYSSVHCCYGITAS